MSMEEVKILLVMLAFGVAVSFMVRLIGKYID